MRPVIKRGFIVISLAAALAIGVPAHADIFGGDTVELAALLTETISQGITLGSQLAQLYQEVEAMRTMLSRLDPASFSALMSLINDTQYSYQALTSDINSIGYTLQAVNTEFKTVFPTDFTSTPFGNFDGLYNDWQNQIWSSTLVAARAQGVLSTLRQNADQAAAVLASSDSASGDVGQLQAVVQMLGIMQSQSNSLIQSLATSGRVIATQASVGASERQLAREKKKRNLANYTKRGAAVTVPNKMP